jgi:hypothetical protein
MSGEPVRRAPVRRTQVRKNVPQIETVPVDDAPVVVTSVEETPTEVPETTPAATVTEASAATVTVSADNTAGDSSNTPDREWDHAVFRDLLAVPKSKNSVPTLTCIDKGFYKRYFIIDVDGDAFKRAWSYYRANHEEPTADEFVTLVLRILEQGMPRMYRAVSYVPLV